VTYPTTGFTPSATVFTPTPGPTSTPANPGVPGPLPTPTPSNVIGVGLKTDAAAEQHMRQAIRNLVSSVDPYARLDLESEDALLDVASEFLDSVTNFSARLARHRSSDSLDVKDLQLHLERHHQIRIPGFAGDDLSKPPAFPNVPSKASGSSKGKEKDSRERPAPALRSKRLAAARAATVNAGKS